MPTAHALLHQRQVSSSSSPSPSPSHRHPHRLSALISWCVCRLRSHLYLALAGLCNWQPTLYQVLFLAQFRFSSLLSPFYVVVEVLKGEMAPKAISNFFEAQLLRLSAARGEEFVENGVQDNEVLGEYSRRISACAWHSVVGVFSSS